MWASHPPCTTHQPETWYQSPTAQRLTLGKRLADRKSEQTHSTRSSANTRWTPVPGSTNICPRSLLTGGAASPPRPWLGATTCFRWEAGDPCHISAPLATTADPPGAPPWGTPGMCQVLPLACMKQTTLGQHKQRPRNIHTHTRVCCLTLMARGKGPLSFLRFAHR